MTPYGAYRSPANAPIANTTACTASSQPLCVTSTTASTRVVIIAPNLGPRGSISTGVLLAAESGNAGPACQMGILGSGHGAGTDRCGDVAEIHCPPLRQHFFCPPGHDPDTMRPRLGCHLPDLQEVFPVLSIKVVEVVEGPGSMTWPSAAITSAFLGSPDARLPMFPSGPSTRMVGVLLMRSRATRSSRSVASISICRTPSTMSATWARIRRVGRHGAQKAR